MGKPKKERKKRKTVAEKAYSLNEAVADIAYIAGTKKYHTGNSREDLANIIKWAQEFEEKWKNEIWGESEADYMTEIEAFALEKIGEE